MVFLAVAVSLGAAQVQAGPPPVISITNTSVAEGDSGTVDMVFTVTRAGDTTRGIVVGYRTVDGTAVAGTDYNAQTGTIIIPAGAASATIRVPVIGNVVPQPNRSFTVELTGVEGTFGPPAALSPQQAFATGTTPCSVAVADFDGDGRPDLAATNKDSDNVTVLRNTALASSAGPSFAPGLNFATGDEPRAVAAGDFNMDGRPDLATANYWGNTVSVLLNTTAPGGAITFAAAQNYATPIYPFSLAVGDFNSDHRPDLAVANAGDNSLSVFLNTTAPAAAAVSFAARADLATGAYPSSVTAADFNGDGRPDLAVANFSSSSVSIFLDTTAPGASAPTFAARADFAAGNRPFAVAAGDFNDDHRPDLALTNYDDNTVSVLLNATARLAAAPAFLPRQTFATGRTPYAITVGDFNGDSYADLAVADYSDHTVSVLVNTTPPWGTSAGFAARQAFGTGYCPAALAVSDFNGSSRSGLAVANWCSNSVSVLLNPASLAYTFAPLLVDNPAMTMAGDPMDPSTMSMSMTVSVATGDYNGDGKTDLVASSTTFVLSTFTITGSLKIYVNTTSAGDGAPSFASPQTMDLGLAGGMITTADFNRDGKPDLAFSGMDTNVTVYLNTTPAGAPAVSFAAPQAFATGLDAATMPPGMILLFDTAAGDFDGDGKIDIIFLDFLTDVDSNLYRNIGILRNTTADGSTTASFAAVQDHDTGYSNGSFGVLALGDFNADGRLDVALNNTTESEVAVLLNTTPGGSTAFSFAPAQNTPAGLQLQAMAAGDINGDGKPDLAVTSQVGGDAMVLLNTTATGSLTSTFSAPQSVTTGGVQAHAAAIRDFDGDGRPDLAVLVLSGSNIVALAARVNTTATGAATASFAAPQTIPLGVDASALGGMMFMTAKRTIDVADFTLDGRSDFETLGIVLFQATTRGIDTPEFLPPQTFTPVDPVTGITVNAAAAGDLNGDDRPDLVLLANDPATPAISTLLVLLNATAPGDATVSFSAPQSFVTAAPVSSILVADINGDFKPDIAVSETSDTLGGIIELLANSTPPLSSTVSFDHNLIYTFLEFPNQIVAGDFNRDFKTDLGVSFLFLDPIFGNPWYEWDYLLNTTPSPGALPGFDSPVFVAPLSQMPPQVFTVADFNRDAMDDLAFHYLEFDMSSLLTYLAVMMDEAWLGSDPVFGSPDLGDQVAGLPSPSIAFSMTASDLDGDGAPDLVLTMGGMAGGLQLALLMNGTLPFSPVQSFRPPISYVAAAASSFPDGITAGDFNLDGRPDLALASGSDTVQVWANRMLRRGWPSLADPQTLALPAGTLSRSVIAADFNRDTRPDLFVFNTVSFSILLNALFGATIGAGTAAGTIVDDDAPASVTAAAGDNQSTIVTTAFAVNLAADVRNAAGNLVQGVNVTFTAPGGGASASFPGPSGTVTVVTNASGRATAPVFTANGTPGGYSVTATAAGGTNPSIGFSLTNLPIPTATTVSSSVNPSVYGQMVFFSAQVVPTSIPGTPTGTVEFFADAVPQGVSSLAGGVAIYPVSTLNAGNHTITAVYTPDPVPGNFSGSTGTLADGQQVNPAATTTTVDSAPDPSRYGQPVAFTATVAAMAPGAGTPTGTVEFFADAVPLGVFPLAGGLATCPVSTLNAGNHTITAVYTPNPVPGNFSGSTGSDSHVVTPAATTTTVGSAPDPSRYGQPVAFTATVAAVAPGAGIPTGTVEFFADAVPLGVFPLAGGLAICPVSTLNAGNHTITAVYTPAPVPGNFITSTGSDSHMVTPAATTTTVDSAPDPSVYGQPVTFTATVAAVAPGAGIPTGTVEFFVDAVSLGTAPLVGGSASSAPIAVLSAGNHPVTAVYTPDTGNFSGSGGALPGGQQVNPTATTTTVVSAPNPSVFGQPVIFTATVAAVAPGAGTPTGTVEFFDGAGSLGIAPMAGGVASSAPISDLLGGSHVITAVYTPDIGNFSGSSGALPSGQQVDPAATATAVTSAPNPSVYGQPVTFTATVAAVAPGAGTPTGTVEFFDGAASLGTAPLSGGAATSAGISTMEFGNHPISAVYTPDTGNWSGSSGSLPGGQQVNATATAITFTSSVNPSVFGQPVNFIATVTVTPPGSGTPTGAVEFLIGTIHLGPVVLAGGTATSPDIANLVYGNYGITAFYFPDDPAFIGGSGVLPGGQQVNPAATTTGVTSSANPSMYGQPVTFTATVTTVPPGAGTPTGTVEFFVDGLSLGVSSLSGGSATSAAIATLAEGNHPVTAVYTPNTLDFTGGSGDLPGGQEVGASATTTGLTSSVNPSAYGQPVTFTAAVAVVPPGFGTPTGTVEFFADAASLGVYPLSGGSATSAAIATLIQGNHAVTAVYTPDTPNFAGSTGTLSGGQQVNPAATMTSVTSSVNPSRYGQPVTFTAAVTATPPAAGTPTGTVEFLVDAVSLGVYPLSGGSATSATIATLIAGNHPVTAVYTPDTANFNASSGALTGGQQVNPAVTTTVVLSSVNPSVYGQPVAFAASVAVLAPAAGTPSGSVEFFVDGVSLGIYPLASGAATSAPIATLPAGNHPVTALYTPDTANFSASSGALTGGQQVNPATTVMGVTSSLNPSVYGQAVTFTATVTVVAPGAGIPAGTVEFFDGAASLGTAPLTGGVASSAAISSLPAGSHSITAVYTPGTPNFSGSSGTLAGGQQVNPAATSTIVTSSVNPSLYGQPVTFTATVTVTAPGSGIPAGTVEFFADAASLGAVPLSGGVAISLPVSSLTVGNHPITTVYTPGNGNFNGSAGILAGSQQVGQAATTTVLVSAPNPSAINQSVTLTATVAPMPPGGGTPTGTVTFRDGATIMGTGALSGVTASLATSALSAGAHTLTASFGGSANYQSSSSPSLSHWVGRPPTITTQPRGQVVDAGHRATLTVAATGDEPMSYQWYHGWRGATNKPAAGATAATWQTPPLTAMIRCWVRVSNAFGHADSDTVVVKIRETPIAPTELSATARHESRIDLSWTDNSWNETGFEIEHREPARSEWAMIATAGADVTAFRHTGLAPGTTHQYRVRAVNSLGLSDFSNEATATTTTDRYIPKATRTFSADGTHWDSDVYLLNLGPADTTADIAFLGPGQDNSDPFVLPVALPAGQPVQLDNILVTHVNLYDAALRVQSHEAGVLSGSRLYNILTPCEGSYGTLVPSMGGGQALAGDGRSKAWFHLLSHSPDEAAGSRTDLGFASASSDAVTIRVTLYGDEGETLGTMDQTLRPYEFREYTRIHARFDTGEVTSGSIAVEVLTPGGRVHPYALLIDNVSGNVLYLPPDILPGDAPDAGPRTLCIPTAAHADTGGAQWRSDVDLLNTGASDAVVTIALLRQDQANMDPDAATVTVPAGTALRLEDVLETVLPADFAALEITDPTGLVLANSRFYDASGQCGGEYGACIPALADGQALAGDGHSLGVLQRMNNSTDPLGGYWTDLGLTSISAVTVEAEVRLYGDDGIPAGDPLQITLQPYEHRRLPRVYELAGSPPVCHGYATVAVLTPGGQVHAYAVLIDRLSLAPLFMNAEILP